MGQLVNTPAACWNKELCLSNSISYHDLTMAANSTLMFSGFNPNSRNSSKVLRPPGGGSSGIFGVKDDQEQERVDSPVQQEKDSETEAPNNPRNISNPLPLSASSRGERSCSSRRS